MHILHIYYYDLRLVNKEPLTQEEDDMVVYYRNLGYGWAAISRHINNTFHTIRAPNQLKNNFNQRLKKLHPGVKPESHHNTMTTPPHNVKNILASETCVKIFKPIYEIPPIR